jgi:predicted nucleic acid-binding protein
LAEYYVTVTEKLRPGLERKAARDDVRDLQSWRPLPHADRFDLAWSIQDRFRLSWWDALIVAAAQASGSGVLLSEDFQDGQSFDGVRVMNPFHHAPDDQPSRQLEGDGG